MSGLHYCAEAFRLQKIFRYGLLGVAIGIVVCKKFKQEDWMMAILQVMMAVLKFFGITGGILVWVLIILDSLGNEMDL